jgi:hypothetical protein
MKGKTMLYEIIAVGFDGCTDATDDRILWVSAPDEITLYNAVEGMPHKGVSDLPDYAADGIDYHLPGDTSALRATLEAFAADLPGTEASQ